MRWRFEAFTIDEDTRQLRRDDVEAHLSPKAFELLVTLIRARPRALSKAELHVRLWPETYVSDASLATLVKEIRGALNETARAPRFVRTVHRHGYAFDGTAMEVAEPARPSMAPSPIYWILAPLGQVPLAAGENIVGRDPRAQVWIDSPSVSRRHARITIDDHHATLEDLKSKNGTHVHGKLVTNPVHLFDGDQIRFGSISVTFRVLGIDASTKSEAGP